MFLWGNGRQRKGGCWLAGQLAWSKECQGQRDSGSKPIPEVALRHSCAHCGMNVHTHTWRGQGHMLTVAWVCTWTHTDRDRVTQNHKGLSSFRSRLICRADIKLTTEELLPGFAHKYWRLKPKAFLSHRYGKSLQSKQAVTKTSGTEPAQCQHVRRSSVRCTSDVETAIIVPLHHKVINMHSHRAWLQGHRATAGTVILEVRDKILPCSY